MHKYIVLVSPAYGGAEKRFFDIFTTLLRRGEAVSLIAPSSLVDSLREDYTDRPDVLAALIPVSLDVWGRFAFIRGFRTLMKGLPRGGHFHYPLNCLWPLHLLRGDSVSMSVADCTSVPAFFSNKKTSWWAWLSFFFVRRIDVLSPDIYRALRGHFRFQYMSLTPGGTYLVPDTMVACMREPTVVFFGRLVHGKGLSDFFDVLPALWVRLRDRVPVGFSFQVAGYGDLESFVVKRVEALKRDGVPISFIGYRVASQLLPRCSVFLSLQEATNYPSRVVAESLMAGCAVIIRDTGDSRLFGTDLPGLQYCHAKLDSDQLAEQIVSSVFGFQYNTNFEDRVREAAIARFGSHAYIDYFQNIMTGKPVRSC